MEMIYHIGAHCTDEGRLLKCLLKNRGTLSRQGIIVPAPGRYRPVLREMLISLRGQAASAEQQQIILDAVMDEDTADRLIFSNESFLCMAQKVLDQHMLYPMAGEKSNWLSQLFPDAPCTFFLALRNPATFIPALFQRSNEKDFATFVAGVDPMRLAWSDMVRRIRNANPQVELVVWCNEDTPLIWDELLQVLSGHDGSVELRGSLDFLSTLMSEAGFKRLSAYLETNPPTDLVQRRKVIAAFLDKYAIPEAVEEELDLPGWTPELVDALTARYEEDLFVIEALEDVQFLAP
ncbi:hypothetical protein [Rhodovulum adriaticum]|uniref:Sulfotransferase family protein n=1 Tax=Rhodovulum adriaticum TaxID=35804 RepID=A0A4R2NN82_RHOAD|nr:hypothetical protein [Rhodovulum adriaticum]MBK1634438.1 hypothetical protein [Rhodovulum adriaticum]TCP23193.1 hypothetical protein EV656_104164 [Rhodovulum adriaticum]